MQITDDQVKDHVDLPRQANNHLIGLDHYKPITRMNHIEEDLSDIDFLLNCMI